MNEDRNPYQEGKRAGVHPALVVFGVIIGMWLLIALAVPSGKQKQATGPEISQVTTDDADAAGVQMEFLCAMPENSQRALCILKRRGVLFQPRPFWNAIFQQHRSHTN